LESGDCNPLLKEGFSPVATRGIQAFFFAFFCSFAPLREEIFFFGCGASSRMWAGGVLMQEERIPQKLEQERRDKESTLRQAGGRLRLTAKRRGWRFRQAPGGCRTGEKTGIPISEACGP